MRILLAICIESYENKKIDLFSWIEAFNSMLREHEICVVIVGKQGFEKREFGKKSRVITLSKTTHHFFKINSIISDFKPDLLYIQGLFAKEVLDYLVINKLRHLKMLLAPLGELSEDNLEIHTKKKQSYLNRLKRLGLLNGVHFQSCKYEELREIVYRLLPKPVYKYTHTLEVPEALDTINDEIRDLYNASLQTIVKQ